MLEMKSLQQIVTEQKNTIHSLQQGQGQGQSQCQGQISQEQGKLIMRGPSLLKILGALCQLVGKYFMLIYAAGG